MEVMYLILAAVMFVMCFSMGYVLTERWKQGTRAANVLNFRTLNRLISVEVELGGATYGDIDRWMHDHRKRVDEQDCALTCSDIVEAHPGVIAVEVMNASGITGVRYRYGHH